MFELKLFHAGAADAGPVAEVLWYTREQSLRNFFMGAPALPLVNDRRTKQAIVGFPAQGTLRSIKKFFE